ncbi:fatty acid desaturase [Donghicola sp.]|jgi:omega-6 fatty acid desaturase (delta-12 desaturase)|uniref:fatty acid desaturase n=1 Tax=Donghicola sp. TaxID=1929294 RepID=UPI0025DE5985|nr:fatty acid desaturase [Donghicola sp.]MCT4579651.1 fatty acid desaturase [Donghicola sp.]
MNAEKNDAAIRTEREWVRVLAKYRDPVLARSITEIVVTLVPLFALWGIGIWLSTVLPILALPVAAVAGLFLVRAFILQHDCGHGALLPNRKVQDMLGRMMGVLTVTPYAVWRQTHAVHHSAAGHLDKRGMGDVTTLTTEEYRARGFWGRLGYRAYRHPLFLFGMAPALLFLFQNRVPLGLMNERRYWQSAMGTNLAILGLLAVFWLIGGWAAILLVWLPSVVVGATVGVWLFYIQHQFEETCWDEGTDWDLHHAALHGSSHYIMPGWMAWMVGYIGIHHVHHLYSRIPFYRLPEVLRDFPALGEAQQLTIGESFACARRHLWDVKTRRLLTFREYAAMLRNEMAVA